MAFEELGQRAQRAAGHAGVSTASSVAKSFLQWFGVPIAAALFVAMDIWDYMFKKQDLLQQYEKETASVLNKRPDALTSKDLDQVGRENPTIGTAIKRLKRKRNLDIFSNIACTVGAFALVATIAPMVAGAGIAGLGAIAITAGLGFTSFLVGKYILDKVGDRVLGLHEPSIRKVEREPLLQEKLSVPSQISYLRQLQNSRRKIHPAQIVTLFQKANAPVNMQDAITLADKLNGGTIDASELAFTVYGQSSGVEERESRELGKLEQRVSDLKDQLSTAQDKLKEAGDTAKEKAGNLVDAVKDKSSDISTKWRDKFANRANPVSPDAVRQSQQNPTSEVSL